MMRSGRGGSESRPRPSFYMRLPATMLRYRHTGADGTILRHLIFLPGRVPQAFADGHSLEALRPRENGTPGVRR